MLSNNHQNHSSIVSSYPDARAVFQDPCSEERCEVCSGSRDWGVQIIQYLGDLFHIQSYSNQNELSEQTKLDDFQNLLLEPVKRSNESCFKNKEHK